MVRGTRYSAIPVMSTEGIHDVCLLEGTVNGDRMQIFVRNYLLPILKPLNWSNPRSVVIIDNASIHHVQGIPDLIEQNCFCFHLTHLISTHLKKFTAKSSPL